MMISTKGRYALHMMIDLAEYGGDAYLPLKDIAARNGISLKYLESIAAALSKNDLLDGQHGKGGGYRLKRPPANYSVGEILRLTEGSLAPVACVERDAAPCERAAQCRARPVWDRLDRMIQEYLNSVSLADLLSE